MHQGCEKDQESILLWKMSTLKVFCLSEDQDGLVLRGRGFDMSNSRALIRDDLRKFEDWANRNLMKSDKKCKALTRVELPNVNLYISQQYALISVQAIPKCGTSLRENYPLLPSSGKAAYEMRLQFLVSQCRKDIEKPKESRRSATKIFRGRKHTN